MYMVVLSSLKGGAGGKCNPWLLLITGECTGEILLCILSLLFYGECMRGKLYCSRFVGSSFRVDDELSGTHCL